MIISALVAAAPPPGPSRHNMTQGFNDTGKYTPAADHWRNLQGYDCGSPADKKAVYVAPHHAACDDLGVNDDKEEEVEVVVAQRIHYQRVQAEECKLVTSDLGFYCGTYDHETAVTDLFKDGIHRTVSTTACRKAHRTGYYTTEDLQPVKRQVFINATTTWNYDLVGKHSDGSECIGGYYKPPGATGNYEFNNVVIMRHVSFTMSELTLHIKGKSVIDARTQTLTSCDGGRQDCETKGRTLIWSMPPNTDKGRCMLRTAKKVRGTMRTDAQGQKTFISHEAGFRFRLKEPVYECGSSVFPTEFPDLVVTQVLDNEGINQPLPAEELSSVLYAHVQDAYLDGKSEDAFKSLAGRTRAQECKRQREERKLGFGTLAAEQRAAIDGETIRFGDGLYATASGEVWYTVACKPVTVLAVDRDDCFTGVPVVFSSQEDLMWFYTSRGETPPPPGQEEQLFLLPGSRLVTRQSAVRECAATMAPYYRNKAGRWLSIDPAVTLVADPKFLHRDPLYDEGYKYEESLGHAGAGLYTQGQRREMMEFQLYRFLQGDMNYVSARQGRANGFGYGSHRRHVTEGDYFPGALPPALVAQVAAYADAIYNLKTFSILIFATVLFMLVSWVGNLYCRAKGGLQHPQITRLWHIATLFCPSCLHIVLRRLGERAKDWATDTRDHLEAGYVQVVSPALRRRWNQTRGVLHHGFRMIRRPRREPLPHPDALNEPPREGHNPCTRSRRRPE